MMMFVVTLPRSASKNPLLFAKKAKKAGADILEIRSDLTPRLKPFRSPLPLLLAIRGEEHGLIDRLKPKFIDWEAITPAFEEKVGIRGVLSRATKVGAKLILSYHNYKQTPSIVNMKKIVQKMCSLDPWMIKFAFQINSYDDFFTLQNLQSFLNKKSVRSTVLAMGPMSHLFRALSPRTNHWTYAYLDGFDSSAMGQISLAHYALLSRAKSPSLFGILGGQQVSSSLSPTIQNALFQRHKAHALYSCFPTDDLGSAWKVLTAIGVKGFSVTAPFKKDILRYLDVIDPLTAYLASANTVLKTKHGWMGYNTDVDGFVRGYPQLKKARDIAILGAGGVVSAIIEALSILAPDAFVTVYARDIKKSARALAPFSAEVRSLQSLKKAHHDAIVCAISDDISVPSLLPAHRPKLKAHRPIAIDLRYGKRTKFMASAEKKGFQVYDGLPMLLHQALRQFEIFTGEKTAKSDVHFLQIFLKAHSS